MALWRGWGGREWARGREEAEGEEEGVAALWGMSRCRVVEERRLTLMEVGDVVLAVEDHVLLYLEIEISGVLVMVVKKTLRATMRGGT